MLKLDLRTHLNNGGAVETVTPDGWRMAIPAGEDGKYRLAQVDDYARKPRRDFDWRPPLRLSLQARVSAAGLPGTWGFGLWNDPFSVSLAHGGGKLLPALPQAAWFFYGSPPNWLSLHDDVPGDGFFAGVICSQRLPVWTLASALIGVPLLALKPGARLARRLAGKLVRQTGASLDIDVNTWHHYDLEWTADGVRMAVDGDAVLESELAPIGPLGVVIWIDNQYAHLTPGGRFGFGTLACGDEAWLDVREMAMIRGGQT